MCLNAIYFFTLSIDQRRQLIEQLHTLNDGCLQFLDIPIFVLNIADPIVEGDTSMAIDFFLKHLLS